jgi:hypothetical protein
MRDADIFYANIHAAAIGKYHILEVAPSDDNTNITPIERASFTHSGEVKAMFPNPELGPRLIVLNGCDLAKLTDGVPKENRMSAALNITDETEGRALVLWGHKVVGVSGDDFFRTVFQHWGAHGPDGTYPTLRESLDTVSRSKNWYNIPLETLTLIGDGDLRFDQVAGFIGQHNILGRWEVIRLQEKRGDETKDVDLGKFQGLTFDIRRGGRAAVLVGERPFSGAPPDAIRWRLTDIDGRPVLRLGICRQPNAPRAWFDVAIEMDDRDSGRLYYEMSDGLQIYTLRNRGASDVANPPKRRR